MLVLSRRFGESIDIGENIKVTVVGKRGQKVSIGIDAPRQVKVLRSELELKGGVDLDEENEG